MNPINIAKSIDKVQNVFEIENNIVIHDYFDYNKVSFIVKVTEIDSTICLLVVCRMDMMDDWVFYYFYQCVIESIIISLHS